MSHKYALFPSDLHGILEMSAPMKESADVWVRK